MTKALAHCHKRGVLHLDVKPANVLVSRRGVCKLGDFGCSIVTSKKRVSSGNKAFLVGTPGYQAPELLLGKVPTAACDVYSLGLLFWQLDSREVPYARQHPQVYHVTKVAIEVYQAIEVTNHPSFPSTFSFRFCILLLKYTIRPSCGVWLLWTRVLLFPLKREQLSVFKASPSSTLSAGNHLQNIGLA